MYKSSDKSMVKISLTETVLLIIEELEIMSSLS